MCCCCFWLSDCIRQAQIDELEDLYANARLESAGERRALNKRLASLHSMWEKAHTTAETILLRNPDDKGNSLYYLNQCAVYEDRMEKVRREIERLNEDDIGLDTARTERLARISRQSFLRDFLRKSWAFFRGYQAFSGSDSNNSDDEEGDDGDEHVAAPNPESIPMTVVAPPPTPIPQPAQPAETPAPPTPALPPPGAPLATLPQFSQPTPTQLVPSPVPQPRPTPAPQPPVPAPRIITAREAKVESLREEILRGQGDMGQKLTKQQLTELREERKMITRVENEIALFGMEEPIIDQPVQHPTGNTQGGNGGD